MLTKVISGGQNGVDQAGLAAARMCGIPTGGIMPKGWRTLDGPRLDIAIEFGMTEHESSDRYPPRTYQNARDSDATLQICRTIGTHSAGEVLTREAAKKYKKPLLQVNLDDQIDPSLVAKWLADNQVSVLNVAGNTENLVRNIQWDAAQYLKRVFTITNPPAHENVS